MAGHTGKYPHGPRLLPTGPFPRKRGGNGRLAPLGPGPPQRAIQRRHLVRGAAGSWWAFLKARTGAHYVDSNHMGAQAARLSVLRSVYAAASPSLSTRGARERRVPGSPEAGVRAPRGSVTRTGLGAAPSASPAWLGPGWGRRSREEGACIREGGGGRRASPPSSPLGDVSQLSPGAPGDLGETPLRDRSDTGCSVSPSWTLGGARPAESKRGTREESSAPGARTQQPGPWGPLERPGAPLPGQSHARGRPGRRAGSAGPRGGWGGTWGRLPLGTFPAGAGALSAPGRRLRGPSAAALRGRRPHAGPEPGLRAVGYWL